MKIYNERILLIIEIISILLLMVIAFFIGSLYQRGDLYSYSSQIQTYLFPKDKNITSITEQSIVDACGGRELEDTAFCLQKQISQIYNYTERDDIPESFDDLVTNGGDCYDYMTWYNRLADDLNFSTTHPTIKTSNNRGHTFAIISNHRGYCILDQLLKPVCVLISNG